MGHVAGQTATPEMDLGVHDAPHSRTLLPRKSTSDRETSLYPATARFGTAQLGPPRSVTSAEVAEQTRLIPRQRRTFMVPCGRHRALAALSHLARHNGPILAATNIHDGIRVELLDRDAEVIEPRRLVLEEREEVLAKT